jgi:hypothetical protein
MPVVALQARRAFSLPPAARTAAIGSTSQADRMQTRRAKASDYRGRDRGAARIIGDENLARPVAYLPKPSSPSNWRSLSSRGLLVARHMPLWDDTRRAMPDRVHLPGMAHQPRWLNGSLLAFGVAENSVRLREAVNRNNRLHLSLRAPL